jgi:hypothetical protein
MWQNHIKYNSFIPYDTFYVCANRIIKLISEQSSEKEIIGPVVVTDELFTTIISDRTNKMCADDFKTKVGSMISIYGLDTFCQFFNHVVSTNKIDLYDECLDNLCDHIVAIMENKEMLKILGQDTIIHIVSCDRINVDEETLFEFAAEWIKVNSPLMPEKILAKIRFNALRASYLSTVVRETKLMTDSEIIDIIASKNSPFKVRHGIFSRFWLATRNTIMPGYRLLTKEDFEMNNFFYRFDKNLKDNKGVKALVALNAEHGCKIYVNKSVLQIDNGETFYNEHHCTSNSVCCINVGDYRASDIEEIKILDPEDELTSDDICIFVRTNARFAK